MEQNRRYRPQDEIPYEQRMKHIIRGYRYLLKKLEYIVPYTHALEERVEQLNERLSKANENRQRFMELSTERNRKAKRLQSELDWLQERYNTLVRFIKERGLTPPTENNETDKG